MTTLLGNKLKELREAKALSQRQLSIALDIDTATYCKIERGNRKAKREQIIILSDLLQIDNKELIRLWSADKIYEIIADEDDASQILNVVAENIGSYKLQKAKL